MTIKIIKKREGGKGMGPAKKKREDDDENQGPRGEGSNERRNKIVLVVGPTTNFCLL